MCIVGINLTDRLRIIIFQKFLIMHIGWYDLPENNTGALTNILSSDASDVNNLVNTSIGLRI